VLEKVVLPRYIQHGSGCKRGEPESQTRVAKLTAVGQVSGRQGLPAPHAQVLPVVNGTTAGGRGNLVHPGGREGPVVEGNEEKDNRNGKK
jgi:hypothetical protein